MTTPGPIRITWIGHATVVIEIGGMRIVTDPALTMFIAHLRRRHPLPTIDEIGADVVAVSHIHMDHLHRPSLRRIGGSTSMIIVPTGSASLVRDLGFTEIHEMKTGDHTQIELGTRTLRIEAVHADHSGSRGPHSRASVAAMGFVFRNGSQSVYFAGDTAMFEQMADIGPVDVALLPVWGWGSTLGERHLNPETAAEATLLLRPTYVIPIHWGTYSPVRARRGSPAWLDSPLAAFRQALRRINPDVNLIELSPGDSIELES